MAPNRGSGGTVKKASELLVITRNDLGTLARITAPLAKNKINIECFTGYEWGTEAAFRLVTDNNRRAGELLRNEGFNVQESPTVVWQTDNEPGRLRLATTALAEANVNTFCAYSTTVPNSATTSVIFGTTDTDRAVSILKTLK